jgi:aspartate/methionine/tyrosine aminotransferase
MVTQQERPVRTEVALPALGAETYARLNRIASAEERLAAHSALFGDTVVNLGTAENVLLNDMHAAFFRDLDFGTVGTTYVRAYGDQELRELMAAFFNRTFDVGFVKDEHVFGTAGVGSALECLAFALKNAGVAVGGQGVLIPAPFWQGFYWSFAQRPELACLPAHLDAPDFRLSLEALQRAYRQAGPRPKVLLLTNPSNPLGYNVAAAELERIYDWALNEAGMHVISDEMYRYSQVKDGSPAFTSALKLNAYKAHPDRIHVLWGFAKDFGLSGFRAGFIISQSPAVKTTMLGSEGNATLSWFSPIDSLKLFVLKKMMRSGQQGKSYAELAMEWYQPELDRLYHVILDDLADSHVPVWNRKGVNPAMFFWLDLRRYLSCFSAAGDDQRRTLFPEIDPREERLYEYLLTEAKVQLLPGGTMSCGEPGYFRLCYTAQPYKLVSSAVASIGTALGKLTPPV